MKSLVASPPKGVPEPRASLATDTARDIAGRDDGGRIDVPIALPGAGVVGAGLLLALEQSEEHQHGCVQLYS